MSKVIAIDYETPLISNEFPYPKPICLSWATDTDSGLFVNYNIQEMQEQLRYWLTNDYLIIAHNATYELLVTYNHFPALKELIWQAVANGNFYCTQLYQQLLDNQVKTADKLSSLADLVKKYFNIDISAEKVDPNAWRMRYSELDFIPLSKWPKEAINYAVSDSVYAMKIYRLQMRTNPNLIYLPHIKATFALNLMAQRGFLIKKDRVELLEKEILDYLNPIYQMLEQKGFTHLDRKGKYCKNVKVLQEYINDNFEFKKLTSQGATQVSSEALDFYILEKPDEIVDAFKNLSKFEKAKSAFVSRLKMADPVIRTGYNAIVRSGRTSSRATSAYPSVNIQQQPRQLKGVTWDIRNCYIPRPGYKLVTIDYNNLELLSCAHQIFTQYGYGSMRDIINSGDKPTDLHSVFACELMSSDTKTKIDYDEYVKHKKEEGYKEYRSKGKPVTLGVPGGMGYDTIRGQFIKDGINLPFKILQRCQYEVVARRLLREFEGEYPNIRVKRTGLKEWSVVYDEVVKLKRILFKLYPELAEFMKDGHKKFLTGESGWSKNDFGEWEEEPYYKYKTLGVERNYCTYTAFCNGFLMQAPSAVGAKRAGWDLMCEYERYERDITQDEVHLLGFIHDEYIFEIKDNENLYTHVDRCAEIMIDSMKGVLTSTRVAVEAEVKPYWSKEISEWTRNYWKDYNSKELKYK